MAPRTDKDTPARKASKVEKKVSKIVKKAAKLADKAARRDVESGADVVDGEDVLDVAAEDAADEGETYTIDELAAHSGVASRTIRFYQAQKLLDRPKRRGRVAVYGPEHVERLTLIAKLQDRGLRLRGMKQLLLRKDSDAAVSSWLGLSDKLSTPWSDDRPKVVDEAELREILGDQPDGTLAALLRAGLVERRDDSAGTFVIVSPGLLEVAKRLVDAGLTIDVLSQIEPILRSGLRDAANGVVEHFVEQRSLEEGGEEEMTAALDALRTHGAHAVSIIFAQEIERTLTHLLEDAEAVGKSAKRNRPRRRRQVRQARRRKRTES